MPRWKAKRIVAAWCRRHGEPFPDFDPHVAYCRLAGAPWSKRQVRMWRAVHWLAHERLGGRVTWQLHPPEWAELCLAIGAELDPVAAALFATRLTYPDNSGDKRFTRG